MSKTLKETSIQYYFNKSMFQCACLLLFSTPIYFLSGLATLQDLFPEKDTSTLGEILHRCGGIVAIAVDMVFNDDSSIFIEGDSQCVAHSIIKSTKLYCTQHVHVAKHTSLKRTKLTKCSASVGSV